MYLRNLPTLVAVVCFFAPLETAVALAVFGFAVPAIPDGGGAQLLLGGLAVVVGRGYETWSDYFRDGGYRDHSARSVLILPFMHLFGVGTLLFVAGPLEGSGVAGDVVLAAVVGGKLLFDLRTLRMERDPDSHGWLSQFFGSEEHEIDPESVVVPAGDPVVTARAPRTVAVVDALARGVTYSLSSGVLVVWLVAAFLIGIGAPSLAAVPLLVVLAFVAFRVFGRYLTYGSVEYRAYDGVLVVYDRLLDEPQARVERTGVTDATVVRDPVDRLFGTRTLTVEGADDDDGPPGGELFPRTPTR
ncbi:DUF6498-containing protein [Halobaculum litoreum]|uniref:DUF6498-containing protein n=1 Tax=Halobaculum litoreum TaxID=3031998 RepID=A0ABD5XR85_9EURY